MATEPFDVISNVRENYTIDTMTVINKIKD